jgi:hypothetical protein
MDDSMLGGAENDDISVLLAECRDQPDRPDNLLLGDHGGHGVADEGPVLGARGGAGIDPSIAALMASQMEMNRAQGEMFKKLMEAQGSRRSSEEDGVTKRKVKEDISYHPQEPFPFVDDAYKIDDDGHEKVDTLLRQRLRPINACPTTYWKKGAFKQCERPILGASLYLEHIMPGSVNKTTICKHHDRCAFIEIKNYLSKNSGVSNQNKKKIKLYEVGHDEFGMGVHSVGAGHHCVGGCRCRPELRCSRVHGAGVQLHGAGHDSLPA